MRSDKREGKSTRYSVEKTSHHWKSLSKNEKLQKRLDQAKKGWIRKKGGKGRQIDIGKMIQCREVTRNGEDGQKMVS